MKTKRQPDSKAVADARVELAAILGELRAIRRRALALARCLKRAAKIGEAVGVVNGRRFTIEEDLGDIIYGDATLPDGGLCGVVRNFAVLARDDHRPGTLAHMKDYADDVACGRA